ncbi:MAG TPA: hypothetical protein VHV83_17060, partial [Armatimonadota bacterium]|nr:hypothetical protein [Armatimonadota bacterium]
ERGVMNWRWLAYDPMLSPNCVEQRIQASVTREGTVTLYDIVFPWPTLGLSAPPRSGSTIGIALLVNDADRTATEDVPSMKRHGLRLFDGILEKNPQAFGRLWIR